MSEYYVGINYFDRFINEEICFEEILGCIDEDIPIDNAILFADSNRFCYNDEEHDLY